MQTNTEITAKANEFETLARHKLASSLPSSITTESLKLDANMADIYGLTSLNKVLFITALCREAAIDLSRLTEDDLANMKTLGNVIDILSPYA